MQIANTRYVDVRLKVEQSLTPRPLEIAAALGGSSIQ